MGGIPDFTVESQKPNGGPMFISDPREKRNGQEPFLVSTMCATITLLCLVTPWSGELQAQVREPETPSSGNAEGYNKRGHADPSGRLRDWAR